MWTKVVVPCIALLGIVWQAVKITSTKVIQRPEHKNVACGSNIMLFCKHSTLQDDVEFYWWKEGDKSFIKPDSRKLIEVRKSDSKFTLLDVNVADSGVYYCQIKHQQKYIWNGSGSQLTVMYPPTPLQILPVEGVSPPRKPVCKTTAFYPEKLEIAWRRNNLDNLTGIHTVKTKSAEGLYEVSSFLEITQPALGIDVYICLVAHVSLTVPTSFSYIVEPADPEGTYINVIFACVVGGSAILLLIIILTRLRLKRAHDVHTTSMEAHENRELAKQVSIEYAPTQATLNLSENKGSNKVRRQERHVVYSETKRAGTNKLIYAAVRHPIPNNTSASENEDKYTVHADVNISKNERN